MTFKIHPVILCGGSGTRLWPLSTPEKPKQFLTLTSDKSMIEETAARFETTKRKDLAFASILVVGSMRHETLLTEKLPHAQKILEPMGRNSAPAVAAACLARAPEDLIIILPADHDIRDVAAFHDAISTAAKAAAEGAIVTFGIEPTHPATGYGYIKATDVSSVDAAIAVEAFVEKPDVETAQTYLDSGTYYWNAGIFLFKASVMLDALATFAPEVLSGTEASITGQAGASIILDKAALAATPSISIDYAVMERANNVKTVPVSMGWSDVGGYRALHRLLIGSEANNYANGPVHIENSNGLYVRSEGPAVSVSGASRLAIVATGSEVMITSIDDDGAVKSLGNAVQQHRPTLGLSQELIDRCEKWLSGTFDIWTQSAWDPRRGGFIEHWHLDGTPNDLANRRVRVQARQIFSFAKSIEMGWSDAGSAKRLINDGIAYLDSKARHPDGGWYHVIDPAGRPVDDRRDLYDHSFLVLAGAAAYRATGNQLSLRLADESLDFMNSQMRPDKGLGWLEGIPAELPRRANPHMHLLEALLALYEVTGREDTIAQAQEIVALFETHLFQPSDDILGEFFDQAWVIEESDAGAVFEPGHHYEWAFLLREYQDITGHDTTSWQRRLIRKADKFGRNSETGFLYNSVSAKGSALNSNSRLWHQLEEFRASLIHPDLVSRSSVEKLIARIFESYLNRGPEGGWVDEIDERGNAISSTVPASMLYHIVTAFQTLTK
ncbi:MAG: AGE family epimerase/isomerase [Pseudomonadota bacterium]